MFEARGGHSLLALQLSSKIEKGFGKRISLVDFYSSPTVKQIVNNFSNDTNFNKWNYLTPLNINGPKNPFFCIGGNMSKVLDYLDSKQQFYSVISPGIRGEQAPDSIEDMATLCLNDICTVQADGPYLIGGYSSGGLMAYEIAVQLQKRGQKIASLILLDPSIPDNYRKSPESLTLHSRSSAKPKLFKPYFSDIHNELGCLSFKEKLIYVLREIRRKTIRNKRARREIKKKLMLNFLSFISWYPIPTFGLFIGNNCI